MSTGALESLKLWYYIKVKEKQLMVECNHKCSECSQNCDERVEKGPLPSTKIKKIIGVLSGKGGVGKSMISSLLAVSLAKENYTVGIMDADITGPSIPKIFGLKGDTVGDGIGIYPHLSEKYQIKIASVNTMLESEETPVLWKGPLLSGMVKQFYTDVYWEDLDYLIIDMPPGTADIALTVLQDLPIDGLVMVTGASKLIGMVVAKAINMAKMTNTKVLGVVENMAYVKCPHCAEIIKIYPEDNTEAIASKYGLEVLAKLPLDPSLAKLSDSGHIEDYSGDDLKDLIAKL